MTPLDIWVPGTPRPKGSMRSLGKGRMVEQNATSGEWRAAVAYAFRQELRELELIGNPPGVWLSGVRVTIRLQFNPPKSWKGGSYPISRATGDVDKHARNILDALVDAGVIKDDSQVAGLRVSKFYCAGHEAPGARIEVCEAAM